MRSVLVMILLSGVIILVGCSERDERTISHVSQDQKEFVCVQEADIAHAYEVVYHRDTKVMYVVSQGSYNCGTFTLLVNPDGTPMIYDGKGE